jgi:hypothetical protein
MENTMSVSTLRPGLLVSLKTATRGNVSYLKNTIESEHLTAEGTQRAKWEMERMVQDPKEHEEAAKVRGKACYLVRSICTESAFGLLCPEDKAGALDRAMVDARALVEEFNGRAKLSRISLYIIAGRIAQDDVEAVKSINSEVRDLMERMADGVRNLDVKKIRDAASEAKSIGQMLSPDAQARIQVAIDAARATATQIKRAGEQAAVEVDKVTIARLAEARTAFLDMDESREVSAPAAQANAVDFEPVTDAVPVMPVAAQAPAAVDLDWMRD